MKASEQARKDTSPRRVNVTSKSPVGDISVVTLIRTDTTLDHSQKTEKVCHTGCGVTAPITQCENMVMAHFADTLTNITLNLVASIHFPIADVGTQKFPQNW